MLHSEAMNGVCVCLFGINLWNFRKVETKFSQVLPNKRACVRVNEDACEQLHAPLVVCARTLLLHASLKPSSAIYRHINPAAASFSSLAFSSQPPPPTPPHPTPLIILAAAVAGGLNIQGVLCVPSPLSAMCVRKPRQRVSLTLRAQICGQYIHGLCVCANLPFKNQ